MFTKHYEDSLGEILMDTGALTLEELQRALRLQADGDPRPIGELLVGMGLVTQDEVAFALHRQRARRGDIERGDPTGLFELAAERNRQRCSDADELAQAAKEIVNKSDD